MAGRIVLFGATGYTGRLVADALVERGAAPVLAARSMDKLNEMASKLGGLDYRQADVSDPDSVRALVERGDVLVSTVGPFQRWGDPALHAAIDGRAGAYIDSTGEAGFIWRVFEEFGPQADKRGVPLVTACAYDYVPGNLAGALALREAGDQASSVQIGYFMSGRADTGAMSGGTAASGAGMMLDPSHGYRSGRLVRERWAKSHASFEVGGRSRQGFSIGATEQFSLPRLYPQLEKVEVFLGWFGPATRAVQGASLATSIATRLPGARPAMRTAVRRFARGSSGGPGPEAREKLGSHVVARACDGGGRVLAEAHVTGVNGYTFTGRIMAWAALRAIDPGITGTGALGPVEAFGLEELQAGCEESGFEANVTVRAAD